LSGGFDFSNAMEKLQHMMSSEDGQSKLKNMIDTFSNGSSDENSNEEKKSEKTEENKKYSNKNENFDFESIGKIKKMISQVSLHNNKHSSFLKALKPYLKKNRQQKLESAMKIINLAQIAKTMKNSNNDLPN
jgi:hypothetical protein